MMRCFQKLPVLELIPEKKPMDCLLEEKIRQIDVEEVEGAICVGDLSDIIDKYQRWTSALPRVKPFYAVKCNDEPVVLKLLANLRTSFDCASKVEIEKILNLGVSPDRIVYANPCKHSSYIRYAAENNVSLMTFDNEDELHKIKALYPDARLLIRILPEGKFRVRVNLGVKFGCTEREAKHLLQTAKLLELNVIGVCFHVGSGCEEAEAFAEAVRGARKVFDIGKDLGFDMTILDIGGGFPGTDSSLISFEEIAEVLNNAFDKYFPSNDKVEIIAEPGRFFMASAFSFALNIIGKRTTFLEHGNNDDDDDDDDDEIVDGRSRRSIMYYINDGVHGVFNGQLLDVDTFGIPLVFKDQESELTYNCSIWGPTCNGKDCIYQDVLLPDLDIGSWLYFKDTGAYTLTLASSFNGMPKPRVMYVCCRDDWLKIDPDQLNLNIVNGHCIQPSKPGTKRTEERKPYNINGNREKNKDMQQRERR